MKRLKFISIFFSFLVILFFIIVGVVIFTTRSPKIENQVVKNTQDQPKNDGGLDFSTIAVFGNTQIYIYFARSEAERARGLSFQKSIRDNEGLFFIFQDTNRHGIWMKDMNFPIDVFWFDENMKVVSIKENFSPDSFPEIVYANLPDRFILETSAGFTKRYGIKIGDTIKILPRPE